MLIVLIIAGYILVGVVVGNIAYGVFKRDIEMSDLSEYSKEWELEDNKTISFLVGVSWPLVIIFAVIFGARWLILKMGSHVFNFKKLQEFSGNVAEKFGWFDARS